MFAENSQTKGHFLLPLTFLHVIQGSDVNRQYNKWVKKLISIIQIYIYLLLPTGLAKVAALTAIMKY